MLFTSNVYACKRAGNRPNVISMEEGIFYARSIPSNSSGDAGTTEIYLVRKDHDKKIDSYNWFNQGMIVLSWSPIKGKVAVMRHSNSEKNHPLSFYLGGELIKYYTKEDLQHFGVKLSRTSCGERFIFKRLGQYQVPGTNNYVFKIESPSAGIMAFDTITGERVK